MGALLAVAVSASVFGFLVGLFTFRRSLRWCPGCGASLCCPQCPGRPSPSRPAAGVATAAGGRTR